VSTNPFRKLATTQRDGNVPKGQDRRRFCWECKAAIAEDATPFFCNQKCGYEWALKNAIILTKVLEK